MNFYALTGLINAITSTVLGLFVYFKNRQNKVNQIFALFCLSAAIWSYGYFFWQIASNEKGALFWSRILMAGAIFIPICYLHFVLSFLNKVKEKRKLLKLGYFLALFFLMSDLTPFFVKGVSPELSFQFWPKPGVLYHPFLFIWFCYLVYSSYLLFVAYQKSRGIRQAQIKYLFSGMTVGYAGGITNYLLWYGIPVPPIGNALVSIYVGAVAYAIVKYRLMDIRLIIRRSLFYFLLILYVTGLYAFLTHVAGEFVVRGTGINPAFIPLIVSFIIVIGLEPIKRLISKYTDKLFYKDQIDYQRILQRLSEIVAREIELRGLLDSILKTIVQGLKVKNGVVLVANKRGKFFRPESYLNGRRDIVLDNKGHLIRYLKKNQAIIVTEELVRMAEDAKTKKERDQLKRVEKELEKLDCALCVPVVIERELTSVMLIGQKLSGDMFSSQEIHLFEVLAPQMAAALEKAKLYQEVQDFTQTLQQKVDRATKELQRANVRLRKLDKAKSEFLSMAAHQLRTPLTALKGYLSMMMEGDYGEIVPKQRKVISTVLGSSERLNRLVNVFLDISRIEAGRLKIEKEAIRIEDLAQKVINNFTPEVRAKGLALEFIKPERPTKKIMLDSDKITDVMNNLIDNALKYTSYGKIIVSIKEKAGQVLFSVRDTGIGINKEDMEGLFVKFTRTIKSEKAYTGGSGLGLYIAKKLIEIHEGRIWAESEGEGKGSTFTFSLPI